MREMTLLTLGLTCSHLPLPPLIRSRHPLTCVSSHSSILMLLLSHAPQAQRALTLSALEKVR